jgi:hypothetical protein
VVVVAPVAAVVALPAAVVADPFVVDGVFPSLLELLPHEAPTTARDAAATTLTANVCIDRFIGISIQGFTACSRHASDSYANRAGYLRGLEATIKWVQVLYD